MSAPREKFQELLRVLFQFDCADLDFGIYRIMNHKRDVIEKFITHDLPEAIADELVVGALADQSAAARALQDTGAQIAETLGENALDADGNLAEAYHDTPLGRKYQELRVKAAGGCGREALEATIFNHLHAFFSHYYQDGDFISKRRYSQRQKYAIPYNGEEVYLHWANNDQYYVKTTEYLHDYTFTSHGVTVRFKLTAADVEQGNVQGDKRFFVPRTQDTEWREEAGEVIIPFEYRPLTEQEGITYGKSNQQDAIIAQAMTGIPERVEGANRALVALTAERRRNADDQPVSFLEHHLRQYARRNTSDYFIHKDLKGFLSRELDFYLKNEVLNLDEMETAGEDRAEGWFQIVRAIEAVGSRIIDFLDQIESFQKMLWEKRKFVTETQYCVTLDLVPEELYPEIVSNGAQAEEWQRLFAVDEIGEGLFAGNEIDEEFLRANPFLVLDTALFPQDFKDRLLSGMDDIAEASDGLLIHSENFNALQLLLPAYRNSIRTIYIDPPYNTDAAPILYKNGYRSSSWAALMADRVALGAHFLLPWGILCATIDDTQQKELHYIVDDVFGKANHVGTVVIRCNPSGRPTQTGFALAHEYAIFARNGGEGKIGKLERTEEQLSRFDRSDEGGDFEWRNYRREGSNSDRNRRRYLFYPIYVKDGSARVPRLTWDQQSDAWVAEEPPLDGEEIVLPIDDNGVEKTWRGQHANLAAYPDEFQARVPRGGRMQVYRKTRPNPEGAVPPTLWTDAKYSATEHGTGWLKQLFGNNPFSYPKSVYAVQDCLDIGGMRKPETTVLDYFAGSGTTAHAVISLNRRDDGDRKYILVEMGEYFDTILLPRIKKVIYSKDWEDGKPISRQGSSHFVKYLRLESYEDALNNIEFDEASGQQAMEFSDYVLEYLLGWETRVSETMLNVGKLSRPFSYTLDVHEDGLTRQKTVDIPETFNYLLGLHVQTRRVYDDEGRRYLVYRGRIDHRQVVVIWRETEGWQDADLERDKKFVAEQKLTDGADEVLVNGDSFIPNAKALEPLFKARMFAPVEA